MKLKSIYFFLIFILLIVVVVFLVNRSNGPGKYDTFAQCLSEKGAVMYGTEACKYCQSQKEDFGRSFKHINYIGCDYSREACLRADITNYPTWIINETKHTGRLPLYNLASLSGCELVEDLE